MVLFVNFLAAEHIFFEILWLVCGEPESTFCMFVSSSERAAILEASRLLAALSTAPIAIETHVVQNRDTGC